jgi:hypothetical protein
MPAWTVLSQAAPASAKAAAMPLIFNRFTVVSSHPVKLQLVRQYPSLMLIQRLLTTLFRVFRATWAGQSPYPGNFTRATHQGPDTMAVMR